MKSKTFPPEINRSRRQTCTTNRMSCAGPRQARRTPSLKPAPVLTCASVSPVPLSHLCLRVCASLCCCWPSLRRLCRRCPSPSPSASSSTSPRTSWFSPSWTTWPLTSFTSETKLRPPHPPLRYLAGLLPFVDATHKDCFLRSSSDHRN